MSYLIRRVLAKPRLILDEMCRLYRKFASYLRRVLCKTHLIFPRINGPIMSCVIIPLILVINIARRNVMLITLDGLKTEVFYL